MALSASAPGRKRVRGSLCVLDEDSETVLSIGSFFIFVHEKSSAILFNRYIGVDERANIFILLGKLGVLNSLERRSGTYYPV